MVPQRENGKRNRELARRILRMRGLKVQNGDGRIRLIPDIKTPEVGTLEEMRRKRVDSSYLRTQPGRHLKTYGENGKPYGTNSLSTLNARALNKDKGLKE